MRYEFMGDEAVNVRAFRTGASTGMGVFSNQIDN